MAPEMIKGQSDEKCELFSVGTIMFQLLSGKHPFYTPGNDNEELTRGKILHSEPSGAGDAWQCVTPQAIDLLKKLLCKTAKKRISAKAAHGHEWFWVLNTRANCASHLTPFVFEGLRSWQRQSRLKKAVLQLLAKEFNETDILKLRCKFEALDRAATGAITLEDLKQTFAEHSGAFAVHSAGQEVVNSELEQIFNSIDSNRHGHIGYNEIISALLARQVLVREEHLLEILDKFDCKKQRPFDPQQPAGCSQGHAEESLVLCLPPLFMSTYLMLKRTIEFVKLLAVSPRLAAGYQTYEADLKSVFAELDRNGDGSVDFYEFCELMTVGD
ncbi:hypothetical protein Efla_002706 [Eimeria flavescens]